MARFKPKKVLKISGIVLGVLVLLMILLPFLFKDKIIETVKYQLNENLNAEVDFGDIGFTLFKNFPNFTLTIEDLTVDGVEQFEGVRLVDIGTMECSIDLMSVISGDEFEIRSFGLDDAKIHVIVLEDGTANYDIAKPSDEVEEEEEPGEFSMKLKSYWLTNTDIIYDDRSLNQLIDINNMNHEGSGDFTATTTSLRTHTDMEEMTYVYEGIPYLSSVKVNADCDLDLDLEAYKFTFTDNEFHLNDLVVGFEGWLAMPADDIDMDIKLNTEQTEFRNILSLVPAIYAADFESIETSGSMSFDMMAKGIYNETSYPGFALNLVVEDGTFHYPGLPDGAKDIQVDVHVKNPGGGNFDLTVVDINKFHVDLAGNSVDVGMKILTPESDPDIDGKIGMDLDLGSIEKVIPLEEGEKYNGLIDADIALKGKLSALDREAYDEFSATGDVKISDLDYQDSEMPYSVSIQSASMNFSPQYVALEEFSSTIGKSDLSLTGRIDNFLAYYLRDDPLKGRFELNSNLLDLDELGGEEEEADATEGSAEEEIEEELEVIEVPGNLDIAMSANVKKVIYDGMDLDNVRGGLTIKDKKVSLDHLNMNTMGGSLDLNGSYDTKNFNHPLVDMGFDITRFDVQQTVKYFSSVKELVPIAEQCTGAFSTKMKLAGTLKPNMDLDVATLNGNGRAKTHQVVVENSNLFSKIGDAVKINDFKNMTLDNVNINFKIEDGSIIVDPFDFIVGQGLGNLAGVTKLDKSIDYLMKLDFPTSSLPTGAKDFASGLAAKAGGAGLDVGELGDRINIDIGIGGTVDNPTIAPKFGGTSGGVKQIITEKIDDIKEDVIEEVGENVEEQIAKIMNEARTQANKIRSESKTLAEKVRKEGYDNADKVVKKASNPIQKAAAKETAKRMKKETDKKADKIIAEGNKKADGIMAAAQKRADALRNKTP